MAPCLGKNWETTRQKLYFDKHPTRLQWVKFHFLRFKRRWFWRFSSRMDSWLQLTLRGHWVFSSPIFGRINPRRRVPGPNANLVRRTLSSTLFPWLAIVLLAFGIVVGGDSVSESVKVERTFVGAVVPQKHARRHAEDRMEVVKSAANTMAKKSSTLIIGSILVATCQGKSPHRPSGSVNQLLHRSLRLRLVRRTLMTLRSRRPNTLNILMARTLMRLSRLSTRRMMRMKNSKKVSTLLQRPKIGGSLISLRESRRTSLVVVVILMTLTLKTKCHPSLL